LAKKVFWFVSILALCIIGLVVLNGVQVKSASIDYEGQPFLGEATASVEIVEFGDYKCPHCSDFNSTALPMIDEQLIQTGKAKFYFINYAFISPDSKTSAQFAEAVYEELGNEKFWEFHHLLFENQKSDDGGMNLFTVDFMKEVLAKVVSNEEVDQVISAYNNGGGSAALQKDLGIAKGLRITSTPTIYVAGKPFKGKSMDELIKMVEEASANGK